MFLEKTTEAAFSFATLKRVQDNSNIPRGQDEDFLTTAMATAEDYIQRYLECSIGLASYRLTLDRFPRKNELLIPMWPVRAITEIAYTDINGAPQIIALDKVVQPVGNGRYHLRLKRNNYWPTTNGELNGVSIEFDAGWQTQKQLPACLTRAGLMLVAHWNENREAVLTGTVSKEVEFGVTSLLELLREEDE